jgi:PAS domain S-box-containing protein
MRLNSIVWKVNLVFITVLVTVIGVSGIVSNVIYERDAVAAARDMSHSHLESILQGLDRLMMERDNEGIGDLIDIITEHDPLWQDIRLVSHEGAVVASMRPDEGARGSARGDARGQESWPCSQCHSLEDPALGLEADSFDQVIELPTGDRAVAVTMPVLNEPRCSSADCHAHPESVRVLGLLEAEFSLRNVDAMTSTRYFHSLIAVLLTAFLSIAATWFTLDRLLGRRVRRLTESTKLLRGMEEVAAGDYSFNFENFGTDEVGELADSFGNMATELQSVVMELKSTRDYMEGIVESSADIIITVGPSGRIRTFNMGAEATLGYKRFVVIGKHIEFLFAEPSERRVAIERLKDTDNVINYETHFLAKDGQVREVILTLSRLRDPDGKHMGTFGISKDVTRENRLKRESLLNARFAAIGQAVTGIHHSMKNMLSSLTGGSYLIETALDEDDKELLQEGWTMVQEGITHITNLSSLMLNYVRELQPELENTDVGSLVKSAYVTTREMAQNNGISLLLDIDRNTPAILADPRLIHSVVMDLVSNAVDACVWKDYENDEKPEVVLRARGSESGELVEIEVEDNGQGMAEEVEKNIFTPFFSTKKKLGTGIGLTMTSRIVRKHGGSIEVESELTRGTKFRVSLPVGGPSDQKKDPDA